MRREEKSERKRKEKKKDKKKKEKEKEDSRTSKQHKRLKVHRQTAKGAVPLKPSSTSQLTHH